MQRSDGTYDRPDKTISLVWQDESGFIARWNPLSHHTCWYDIGGESIKPQPGRWLPWTPPVFPVRKKNRIRTARVKFRGIETIGAWFDVKGNTYFTWAVLVQSELHFTDDATLIEWLQPEYEDELTEGT